jgi:hypothetical protein
MGSDRGADESKFFIAMMASSTSRTATGAREEETQLFTAECCGKGAVKVGTYIAES